MKKQRQNQSKSIKNSSKATINILHQPNFSSSIIETEIQIEMGSFGIKEVQNLMNLYSRAVDYFVANQSNKFLYFQNKMKQLLLKPSVVALIDKIEAKGKNENLDKNSNIPKRKTDKLLKVDAESIMKKQSFNLTRELSTMHQKKNIENLMVSFKSMKQVKDEIFVNSLSSQKNDLRVKLEKRRQSQSRNTSRAHSRKSNRFKHRSTILTEGKNSGETTMNESSLKFGGVISIRDLLLQEPDNTEPAKPILTENDSKYLN